MPVQTQLQIRRDTAANWSSTNPTLASGEWGLETDTRQYKIGDGVTAWNSLGYQLGPLLDEEIATDPDGAYFTGSGVYLPGRTGQYLSSPDANALDITGDIDLRVKVALDNYSVNNGLISKLNDTTNNYSYQFRVNNGGALRFVWSANGSATLVSDSSVATGISNGDTKWLRVTLDVDNGATQNETKFYTSDDGSIWTQLGTTITKSGTTSIFNSNAPLDIGQVYLNSFVAKGTFYRAQILNGIGGTTAFDANFETVPADSFAFTESSANAATVTLTTTRYSFGLPGATLTGTGTQALAANNDFYVHFKITGKGISVKNIAFEVTGAPASNATAYLGIYATDAQGQPTGSALYASSGITVLSGAAALYRLRVTPFTLMPGNYIIGVNTSVQFTVRTFLAGGLSVPNTLGAAMQARYQVSRTNAAFTNSPSKWNSVTTGASSRQSFNLLGWS